jgi:hypothetical protein
MDEKLKATITQRIEGLEDEQAKQLLDYIEFLDSKYNRSSRDRSPFERLADNVEGSLRATRIGGAAIKGTAQVLDAASSVVRGVADAGMAVVDELQRLDEEPGQKDADLATEGENEEADVTSTAEASTDAPPSNRAEPDGASEGEVPQEGEDEKSS